VEEGCTVCRKTPYHFDEVIRLGPYDGLLRDVVLRMKRSSGEGLAERIGALWFAHAGSRLQAVGAHAVVPVPLHWWRHFTRGYNQSGILAEGLAKGLGLPVRRCLRRVRATPAQTQQTPAGRWENVRGAFRIRRRTSLAGKTILLVDDVLTTGSTCNEAARTLKAAGAARVVVAALAKSHP
jgi:ComF family protein